MGLTYLAVDLANPARPEQFHTERFLIDSGAAYSVVQRRVLKDLGIQPHSRRTFILANGDQIERPMGDALFRYKERRGAAPVVFGEPGDSSLLGVVTLEALGYVLDPLTRELRPSPMLLATVDYRDRMRNTRSVLSTSLTRSSQNAPPATSRRPSASAAAAQLSSRGRSGPRVHSPLAGS